MQINSVCFHVQGAHLHFKAAFTLCSCRAEILLRFLFNSLRGCQIWALNNAIDSHLLNEFLSCSFFKEILVGVFFIGDNMSSSVFHQMTFTDTKFHVKRYSYSNVLKLCTTIRTNSNRVLIAKLRIVSN